MSLSHETHTGTQVSSLARLRPYNLVAGSLHIVQALAILVLANDFSLPVGATYMTGPPGPDVGTQVVTLFNLSFAGASRPSSASPRWHTSRSRVRGGRRTRRISERNAIPTGGSSTR